MTTKKRKINCKPTKKTIEDLNSSRDGGQIALKGFTYQFLYSCYILLSESNQDTVFYFEGIEDIDKIVYEKSNINISNIQLKYSSYRQNASFLKDILKNFLEVYLIDSNRNFKLVYDFLVADGNMTKLFNKNLDLKSISFWKNKIDEIKTENPHWKWDNFNFDKFINIISFEKFERKDLEYKIEQKLIERYEFAIDNISLFVNAIYNFCLSKMTKRESAKKLDLDQLIISVIDDISKGVVNPSFKWLKRINFNLSNFNVNQDLKDQKINSKKGHTNPVKYSQNFL